MIPALGSLGAGGGDVLPAELQRRRRRQARRGSSSPARSAPTSSWSRWSATTAPASARPWRRPPRVGDSWVFRRLSEELTRSRWSGLPPWDALHALADELGLPELDDFADIMRLSGEEGASVYANLRARSAAMRTAMLNDEIAEANAIGERMTIPGSLLGVIFMALLVAPSLLRMFTQHLTGTNEKEHPS